MSVDASEREREVSLKQHNSSLHAGKLKIEYVAVLVLPGVFKKML